MRNGHLSQPCVSGAGNVQLHREKEANVILCGMGRVGGYECGMTFFGCVCKIIIHGMNQNIMLARNIQKNIFVHLSVVIMHLCWEHKL